MISNKDLEELALKIFHTNGQGITFSNLINEFGCSQKQAQRRLKNAIKGKEDKQGILFTLDRKSPQQYYLTRLKAEIIEQIKKQNRPNNPTGVSLYQSYNLEHIKARYIRELLSLLQNQPISIHKLQLKLFIDKNYYEEIDIQQITKGNKSKSHEEKFGPRNVKYEVYPSGTIMIYIASSNHPFKLEVEEDVSSFFAFLGQVKDRLVNFLNDFSEKAIPSVMSWILVQCDINKDIGINIIEQLSIPDLQLRVHDRIFRLYVKSIHGSSYYRIEESKQVNQEIRLAIPEIMNISQTINHSYYDYDKFHYIQ
ncbi:MAG TPA: hypothetical protein VFP49_07800 [Nitrososphaeraceae archaeon]|nr:hypothetical protein [Nitrososphaeraceae archaeon]